MVSGRILVDDFFVDERSCLGDGPFYTFRQVLTFGKEIHLDFPEGRYAAEYTVHRLDLKIGVPAELHNIFQWCGHDRLLL